MKCEKRTVAQGIAAYLAIMLLFFLVSCQNRWQIGQREYYLWGIGAELLGAALTACAIGAFGLQKQIGLRAHGFGRGLFAGALMLAYSVAYFALNTINYGVGNFIRPDGVNLLLVIGMMIAVALFEELLFRGFLLNTFLNHFAGTSTGTKKRLLCCVFASSVLFGCNHFINLIVRPELFVLTLCQAVYTIFAGVFFSAVYLKSKNLWSVIFYHALFDVATTIFYEILSADTLQNSNVHYASAVDQAWGQGLFYVAVGVPLLVCGLAHLKKVEV